MSDISHTCLAVQYTAGLSVRCVLYQAVPRVVQCVCFDDLIHDSIVLATSQHSNFNIQYLPTDSLSDFETQELLLTILLLPVQKVLHVPHTLLQPLNFGGSSFFYHFLLLLVKQVGPYRQKELFVNRAITNVSPGLASIRD